MYHFSEAIYIYIYAFSAIIGLPYFCVLEYQQSDKNISPSKVKKFIWPTVLPCKKVFVYLTIEWQWWRYDWILHSPEGQRHCRFCQCFSSRFVMQVGALTASMWRRSHRIAQVLEETGLRSDTIKFGSVVNETSRYIHLLYHRMGRWRYRSCTRLGDRGCDRHSFRQR